MREARVSAARPYDVRSIRAALQLAASDPRCQGTLLTALQQRFAQKAADTPRQLRIGASATAQATGLSGGEFLPALGRRSHQRPGRSAVGRRRAHPHLLRRRRSPPSGARWLHRNRHAQRSPCPRPQLPRNGRRDRRQRGLRPGPRTRHHVFPRTRARGVARRQHRIDVARGQRTADRSIGGCRSRANTSRVISSSGRSTT